MKDLKEIALQVSRTVAKKTGFQERQKAKFSKNFENGEYVFFLELSTRYGSGEMTPYFGVEVPLLDRIIRLFPGTENVEYPTFGGQSVRFPDLSRNSIFDYVIEVETTNDLERYTNKLFNIWDRVGVNVFDNLSSGAGWVKMVEEFLLYNKLGAINIPTAGRTCVSILYAAGGVDRSRKAFEILVPAAVSADKGRYVHDYKQAQELHNYIVQSPEVVSEIRKRAFSL